METTPDFREVGKKCLGLVLNNEKNISIFEKNIFEKVEEEDNSEKNYKKLLYQTCYRISKDKDIKKILKNIKEDRIGWDSDTFQEIKSKLDEQDEFITNPFTVVEGVLVCKKCGSNKTYSYTKQVRRADEGTTVFCICVKCNARWKEN